MVLGAPLEKEVPFVAQRACFCVSGLRTTRSGLHVYSGPARGVFKLTRKKNPQNLHLWHLERIAFAVGDSSDFATQCFARISIDGS